MGQKKIYREAQLSRNQKFKIGKRYWLSNFAENSEYYCHSILYATLLSLYKKIK